MVPDLRKPESRVNKTQLIFGLLLLMGAGYLLKNVFLVPPEQKIKRQLDNLASVIQKLPQDSNIKKATQISSFGGYFTPDVTVRISHPRGNTTSSSRAEIIDQFKGFKSYDAIHTLKVAWGPVTIQFPDGDKTKADVTTSIIADHNGQAGWLNAPVKLTFLKENNSWKISSLNSP